MLDGLQGGLQIIEMLDHLLCERMILPIRQVLLKQAEADYKKLADASWPFLMPSD